ncbi:D-galactarate dehydratase [Serratia fonticola]|uniref:D-galactarate dehydratase n=1 Tax=Serratia fonticola TaxID=47917 RepID=A0A4U9VAQ2_SERFO|nr:D-galactarate dehydratase [Serratia fonticola]
MSEYAVGSIKALPRYIQVHRQDNVAIVVNDHGLPKGASFPCGLTLLEHIPQGHKVALQDIPQKRHYFALWRSDWLCRTGYSPWQLD